MLSPGDLVKTNRVPLYGSMTLYGTHSGLFMVSEIKSLDSPFTLAVENGVLVRKPKKYFWLSLVYLPTNTKVSYIILSDLEAEITENDFEVVSEINEQP